LNTHELSNTSLSVCVEAMDPQELKNLYQESYLVDTISKWPSYLPLTTYDLLDLEGFQNLSDLAFPYDMPITSRPCSFELPSPISDHSPLDEEDTFDYKDYIEPRVMSDAFDDNSIIPATPCCTLSRENSPAMDLFEVASSFESSGSNSPRDTEHDMEARKPRKPKTKARKRPSEDYRAESPGSSRTRAHNLIEKRYRNNLNSKIKALRDILPSPDSIDDSENAMDCDARESKRFKWNKGAILGKAISYITEIETQNETLLKENARLRRIIGMRYQGTIQGHILKRV